MAKSVKGSVRRKIMAIELSKEMKSQAKKTNPRKNKSQEHELFAMIDSGLNNKE